MNNSFRGPQSFKQSSWANRGSDQDKDGNQISGFCSSCRKWDAELKKGYCRDRECQENRENDKVKRGDAIRIFTDVINKQTGKLSTGIEKGSTIQFFDKEPSEVENE